MLTYTNSLLHAHMRQKSEVVKALGER